jgi:DNA polymerase-3 subunit delta'
MKIHLERIKNYLLNSLKLGRVGYFYLFLGQQGVGKYTLALWWGKLLSCLEGKGESCFCISCSIWDKFLSNEKDISAHPDFCILPRGSPYITIDMIHELKNKLYFTKMLGKRKGAIIPDSERFTQEAENALLKILEEPPGDTVFIMTAASSEALFSTIISRAKIISFPILDEESIKEYLKKKGIYKNEDIKIAEEYAFGSISRATMYLEEKIDFEKWLTLWRNKRKKELFATLDRIFSSKEKLLRHLELLLSHILNKREAKFFLPDKLDLFYETWRAVNIHNVNPALAIKALLLKLDE